MVTSWIIFLSTILSVSAQVCVPPAGVSHGVIFSPNHDYSQLFCCPTVGPNGLYLQTQQTRPFSIFCKYVFAIIISSFRLLSNIVFLQLWIRIKCRRMHICAPCWSTIMSSNSNWVDTGPTYWNRVIHHGLSVEGAYKSQLSEYLRCGQCIASQC
jgi:hypothetical protein